MSQETPKLATRVASQKVLEVLTQAVPEMVGGSADLSGSNGTKTSRHVAVTPDDFSGLEPPLLQADLPQIAEPVVAQCDSPLFEDSQPSRQTQPKLAGPGVVVANTLISSHLSCPTSAI